MGSSGNSSTQKQLKTNPRTMTEDLYLKGQSNIESYTNKIGLTDTGEFISEKGWQEKISKIINVCKHNPKIVFHQITNASLLTRKNIEH